METPPHGTEKERQRKRDDWKDIEEQIDLWEIHRYISREERIEDRKEKEEMD